MTDDYFATPKFPEGLYVYSVFLIRLLLVQAIYGKTQPQFLQYIYLVAPISLVILNPIGFILLEIQKARAAAVKRSVN